MFPHDTTELDALILVGDDPASAERCLTSLVSVSLDLPLRTWVVEVRSDLAAAEALHHRCVWTRTVAEGGTAERLDRALSQGNAPLVLVLDGGYAIDADAVRELVRKLRADESLSAVGLGVLPRLAHDVRPGAIGPALLVRRDALDVVGRFDERGFAGMQAEAEAWIRRAQRAGLRVQVTSTAPVTAREASAPLTLLKPLPRVAAAATQRPILERRTYRTRVQDGDHGPESLRAALVARAREALR